MGKQHSTYTVCLTFLQQVPTHCILEGLPLSIKLASIESAWGPLHQTSTNPCPHCILTRDSAGLQFWWRWCLVSFQKQTRAHQLKTGHSVAKDRTLSIAGKERVCRQLAWRIEQPRHNNRLHASHSRDFFWSTSPGYYVTSSSKDITFRSSNHNRSF